ncbi:hypothetical protein OOU_Y34scaffold00666g114 [Pyricularia oryzae Y34]|uniref:Uncharacterized protein n=2 Tax=Pyricularia oryzae TaxID=318829 RepID=Q2KGB8_PYRO7|nr:hypothetical protein MGCH7_ch7g417 [Pyricularia oryzae 70-15]ELQ36253.1 hypothetical protein OOU_Y34scaffold00666g114 [Pyricularia oryzae Y34]
MSSDNLQAAALTKAFLPMRGKAVGAQCVEE